MGTLMTEVRSVLHFSEVGLRDVPTVGGKGASLGELTRAGIRVPTGYAVTTAAFRQAVQHLTVDGEPIEARVAALDHAEPEALAAETARIRAVVESAPLPAEVAEAISTAYAALCEECGDPDQPVAVRSSATSEDSAEDSFAGLQDTYLWVRGGDSVVEHVRRCWASLYSVESVTYRLRRGIPETDLGMAVVVQRMVGARSSGVMFTRSPISGDRSVVAIDASWGLGSAVVSGDVTPDAFVISKVTGEIARRTIATKTRWHRPDPSGSGVVETDVPAELQDRPSISDDEIAELVAIARRVEAHYGSPQDIEWAVAEDAPAGENVFLLQSRPETVWAEKDAAKAAAPVAAPAANAFDHVFNLLGGKRPSSSGS
jgi:pyruvate,water dikinase